MFLRLILNQNGRRILNVGEEFKNNNNNNTKILNVINIKSTNTKISLVPERFQSPF